MQFAIQLKAQDLDYNYEDENEGPLSKHIFENIVLFQNMRGMFTDLNIYSSFFDEKQQQVKCSQN